MTLFFANANIIYTYSDPPIKKPRILGLVTRFWYAEEDSPTSRLRFVFAIRSTVLLAVDHRSYKE